MKFQDIIIWILSSSILSSLISTFIFEPIREKRKYRFDEKKRVYQSIVLFAQGFLYPEESKYAINIEDDTNFFLVKNIKNI